MKLRAATAADVEVVLRLRQEAHEWLATLGSDQWRHPYPSAQGMVDRITTSIEAGETWMVEEDGQQLATITIDRGSDDGLWTPDELQTALFLHRMILDRTVAGRGLGAELLDFAGDQAEQAGRHWIRLDCWTTNHALHDYYRGQGFHHVRSVEGHYSGSAACFERSAADRSGTGLFTTSSEPSRAPRPHGNVCAE